nr:MAG TPA: hypothetical protein [Caudoviricetes sp.]
MFHVKHWVLHIMVLPDVLIHEVKIVGLFTWKTVPHT